MNYAQYKNEIFNLDRVKYILFTNRAATKYELKDNGVNLTEVIVADVKDMERIVNYALPGFIEAEIDDYSALLNIKRIIHMERNSTFSPQHTFKITFDDNTEITILKESDEKALMFLNAVSRYLKCGVL